jgi:EmrB/QacA subfamily drug resistance transporter
VSEKSITNKTAILAIVLISYTMIVLDISITITGLPKIHHDLNFSLAGLSWVQNAYTLAFGGLLLLGARLGDIFGRRRMFMVGTAVFTLASLGVGLAQSSTGLVMARALQGVGAAILAPSTLALLTTSFAAGRERTRAVAYYGAVAGVAASIGLVLGGIFAGLLSWRVGFFMNLPIGIAVLLATPRFIAESEPHKGALDIPGALASTIGMTSLVYGIVRSAEAGWADPITLVAFIAGLLLIAAFIFIEKRAKQPIMPLRLFASRERAGAYAARALFLGGMLSFWFFTTQFLQSVLNYSPTLTGLAFLATTIPNFVMAMYVPRLTHRFGNAPLLASSLLLSVTGMLWLSRVSPHTTYLIGIALPMALIGMGQGGSLAPLTSAGIADVTARDAGAASGVVNVAHQLGGSLGLSILVAVFAAASTKTLTGSNLLGHQISVALSTGSVMLALAFIVTFAFIIPKKVKTGAST